MNKNTFQPGPRCGNCERFDRNRDKAGQPINIKHIGSFCGRELDPKECGDGFKSRHNGGKKKRNCKSWQQNNI